jgi:dihydroorotase
MSLLIQKAEIIDPEKKWTGVQDVLIEKGRIARIAKDIKAKAKRIVDAKGKFLLPGLVDLHVHVRQPGREDVETIETASHAALRGGFTTICAMPNTQPACDNETVAEYIRLEAKRISKVHVYPIGAISRGRKGEELTDIGCLKKAGIVALSDDGSPVMNAELMRRAMEYAHSFNLCVIDHAEDTQLSAGGVMNEGAVSTRLGLRGIPNASESVMISRNIALSELTGCSVHIAHVSTRKGCEMIRCAQKQGLPVTGEVTPHHLILDDESVSDYDARYKMNPPLRSKKDVRALQTALQEGVLMAVATDHAPHAGHEKAVEFDQAPFGVIGLETALGVCVKALVQSGAMKLETLVHRMSLGPANILGLDQGRVDVGREADLVLIDLKREWEVKEDEFLSKSKNSPFIGWHLPAQVTHTIVSGEVAYEGGRVV